MEAFRRVFPFALVFMTAFVHVLVNGEDSEQMVAFLCNRPSMYKTSDGWVKDDSIDCLKDPEDILDYCRKVYPDVDVRNIVEANEKFEIDNWCDFGQNLCHHKFTVRPFRCLVGPFQSDALLVPEHCVFDHVHDAKQCMSFAEWNRTAVQSCASRQMSMQSFAILQPCGVDKFNGVEFVCCPRDQVMNPSPSTVTTRAAQTTARQTTSKPLAPVASTKQSPVAVADVDSSKLSARQGPKDAETGDSSSDADSDDHRWNEHEYYAKARKDMQKHHHEKIAKMMKEWSAARQRVQDLKATDSEAGEKLNRDITSKFQKMYETEESEAEMEKKQLIILHQQRVQAELDDRKRRMLDKFIEAIEFDYENEEEADPVAVLKALTGYIKALQKDRMHTVNRYRHLLETEQTEAGTSRSQMVQHLLGIDRQMTGALAMLDRLPIKYAVKIRKQIADYLDAYHAIDASILMLFGPLHVETTTSTTLPTTTPTTTTTTTTTIASTTTTTTTTVAPIIDGSDDDDDEDDDDEDDDDDEPSNEKNSENHDEEEFKNAMMKAKSSDEDEEAVEVMKAKSSDEDEETDEDDDEVQEKKIVKQKTAKRVENDSESDDDEDDDEEDDDDDDKPLTKPPTAATATHLPSKTTASPMTTATSVTSRIDEGLFEDRGDSSSSEAAEQFESIDYVHVQLPASASSSMGGGGHADNLEKSPLTANQALIQKKFVSSADGFSAVPLGIAVGCITVCVVIIAGVVVMRRRGSARRRGAPVPAGPGRLNLDPSISPEERHLAAMQMTGYENPTYKYFEAASA